MTDVVYSNIMIQVEQLDLADQLHLLDAIAELVQRQVASKPKPQRRIRELRGLGKEVWNHLDAQAYVNQERDAWH